MKLLTPAATESHRIAIRTQPDKFGLLIGPRSFAGRRMIAEGATWAMDNDAYNGFDPQRYVTQLIVHAEYRKQCLFAVIPDEVGDHQTTMFLWHNWYQGIKRMGYPVAFVAQDGCTLDVIPWSNMNALFVGGTDHFKDKESVPLIREAKQRGVWVHVGRVNTPRRWRFCAELGVDSFDGTGFAIAPDIRLRQYQNWVAAYEKQGRLL